MLSLDALPLAASASNLLAAREQMAFTLGFHIVLSCLGVALPATILVANYIGLKRGDADAMELAKRWSKAMAVTFAVGAVTGTVLTFEFGLLWPHFMDRFGAAFGIAFAIEGIFFFLEAIFLAIYIYGWKRLSGWAHFWSGVPMFVTGIGGAFAVVAANSWMNQPQGFTLDAAGKVIDTNPWKVLINPATGYEVPHMILAAYMVVGFLVASIYAVGMLKGRRDRLHRLGLLIPLTIGLIATPIQLLVGDTAARAVADHQPAKFAGMECIQETGGHQTEYIGGICTANGVKFAIPIPDLDSFLVGFSADTKVIGLNDIPDGRTAAGQHAAAPRLRRDGRDRLGAAAARALARLVVVEKARHPGDAVVPARGRDLRRRRDPGAVVRLDRDRGRAPAVDRPGLHADRGSGHRRRRPLVRLRRGARSSTRRWGRSRSSSCGGCHAAGASRAAPTATRPAPPTHPPPPRQAHDRVVRNGPNAQGSAR